MNRILQIEDDPAQITLLQAAFRPPAWHFHDAKTLHEGLFKIKGTPIPFDAVILDLTLPDAKELEGLFAITEVYVGPVIVVSGQFTEKLAIEAIEMGAQDVLLKASFTLKDLSARLLFAMARQRHGKREDAKVADALCQMSEHVKSATLSGREIAGDIKEMNTTMLAAARTASGK